MRTTHTWKIPTLAASAALLLLLTGCSADPPIDNDNEGDNKNSQADADVCTPGEQAMQDCNTCVCDDQGRWVCTTKDCTDDVYDEDANLLDDANLPDEDADFSEEDTGEDAAPSELNRCTDEDISDYTAPPNARALACSQGTCRFECDSGYIDLNEDLHQPDSDGCEAIAGGTAGTGWDGAQFPNLPMSLQMINGGGNAGERTKYIYYKIDASTFAGVSYIGSISVVPTTNSSNSLFSPWISFTPGGEPIALPCAQTLALETVIYWSTNHDEAPGYTCKINPPNIYYLNVSDRNYEQLIANESGSCTNSSGCEFAMTVYHSIQ